MRKWKLYTAMALAAAALAGTAVPAQAASSKSYITEINGRKCVVWVVSNCTQKPDTGTPEVPETPETPETPEVPETPETPETPEVPETPGTPEIPDVPEVPETPEIPDIPEVPETPDNPETPDVPDTPAEDSSYEAQVVRLVNEERAKAGLSALTVDTGLEAAGLVRAKEIVSNFSHTRPNGTSFVTAIKEQGVFYRGAGENIAWGQKSPEAVVDAWMNSPGHRANILNEKFTRIGVGYYQNNAGTNYWVQLFAY